MQLNLPIFEQLAGCKSLLIAGMGGGFDIFCGLPICFELKQRGFEVHLANLSFSLLKGLKGALRVTNTLVGITANQQSYLPYFPELYLAQWFKAERNEDATVWCFEKTGVRPLLENYKALIEYLSIDGIVLIDGGVDSLIRGDEIETGSIPEDTTSLAAINELDNVPLRITACLGFGAELEISYAHVLENVAGLAKEGGFLGSCSLIQQMEAYQLYESAVLHVQNNPNQIPSVINSSVISAAQGYYGDYHLTQKTSGSTLWISPLMPIYWFFDLPSVARRNMLLPEILLTETAADVQRIVSDTLQMIPKRSHSQIPLL